MKKKFPAEEMLKDDLICIYVQLPNQALLDLHKIGLWSEPAHGSNVENLLK